MMTISINLNNKFQFETIEINDIIQNGFLPVKIETITLLAFQFLP